MAGVQSWLVQPSQAEVQAAAVTQAQRLHDGGMREPPNGSSGTEGPEVQELEAQISGLLSKPTTAFSFCRRHSDLGLRPEEGTAVYISTLTGFCQNWPAEGSES